MMLCVPAAAPAELVSQAVETAVAARFLLVRMSSLPQSEDSEHNARAPAEVLPPPPSAERHKKPNCFKFAVPGVTAVIAAAHAPPARTRITATAKIFMVKSWIWGALSVLKRRAVRRGTRGGR